MVSVSAPRFRPPGHLLNGVQLACRPPSRYRSSRLRRAGFRTLTDPKPPDILEPLRAALAGTYAVERELGRGGMATVYLAEDVKHRRAVAIKVLNAELAASLGSERFLREIELAARLQHPHIVPLYDSGTAGGFLYYVMPFIEGETLRSRIDREKQLDLDDTLRIAAEAGSALAYAHSQGIVHRDIKPENIMLTGGHAVVTDFGIARAVTAAGTQSLTKTGTIIGTPAYMSPEQATGRLEIDGRSDTYSLACVVYEMIVGEPPFTGPTALAVIARHSMDHVSPPSIVRATIPEAAEDALLKALAKVPADRFATTHQFVEALRAGGGGATGVRRRPTGAIQQQVPIWKRRKVALAVGGVALLGAVAFATRSLWSGGGAPGAGPDVDRHKVAILYFRDQSRDKSLEFLADGLTDALIQQLSQVGALQVTSRSGVRSYKNTDLPADSIGRALKVGTIVEGSVAQSGDRLRVSVSLVNVATGAEIGAKTLERPRTEIFELQDELAGEVAAFLRQRLGEAVELERSREGTRNAQAWELVQQAQQLTKDVVTLLAAADTAAAGRQLARADTLLARAADMDRRWATPVVKRGWVAHQQLSLAGTFETRYYDRWLTEALKYAEQALALDPKNADALELRGTERYYQWVLNLVESRDAEARVNAAEGDLRASVEEDPNRASAWALLSHLYLRKSQPAEAKLAALHAYESDPYLAQASSVLWRLYQTSLDLEDAVEAGRWCEEGRRRFATRPEFTECRITQYALAGARPDVPRMWQLLQENVQLYPRNQREYRRRRGELLVAMTLVRAGLADSARHVALRARADAVLDPGRELTYIEALLRSILGDKDEALRLIGLYLATNPQERASMAKDDTWWWRGLKNDPGFQALVGTSR